MVLHNNFLWLTKDEAKKFSRLHATPLTQKISLGDYNHAIQVSVDWQMRENTVASLRAGYELFITQLVVSPNGALEFDSNATFLGAKKRSAV
jgi:hypothetical protein